MTTTGEHGVDAVPEGLGPPTVTAATEVRSVEAGAPGMRVYVAVRVTGAPGPPGAEAELPEPPHGVG